MSVVNWSDLEQRFGASVKLARRPVAVAFLDSAPAHVAQIFGDGAFRLQFLASGRGWARVLHRAGKSLQLRGRRVYAQYRVVSRA